MNLLDMFEGREPHQQAIDKLEQNRIDHLEEKMDYYAKHGMVKEFQKAKEERDSYFKVQDECMGYGTLVGEADSNIDPSAVSRIKELASQYDPKELRLAHVKHFAKETGIPVADVCKILGLRVPVSMWEAGLPDVADKQQKMDRLTQPGKVGTDVVTPQQRVAGATMPAKGAIGKAKETFSSFVNWLKGGPETGPTYESAVAEQEGQISAINAAKYAYEQMRKAHEDNVDIATIRWMGNAEPITMSRNQLYHTLLKLKGMSRQNRNQFALQTLANRNNFALWLGGQKKVTPRAVMKPQADPMQPELPLGKPAVSPVQERAQKKNSEEPVAPQSAEVQRYLTKVRRAAPNATSDLEAIAKDEIENQRRTQQTINDLEAVNDRQDQALKKSMSLDRRQSDEIDDVEQHLDQLAQKIQAIKSAKPAAGQTAAPAVVNAPTKTTKTTTEPKQTTKPEEPQAREPEPTSVVPAADVETGNEVEKKVQGLERQLQQLRKQPPTPQNQDKIKNLDTRLSALQAQVGNILPSKAKELSPQEPFPNLDIQPPKKSAPRVRVPKKDVDLVPKQAKVSKPRPNDEFDILDLDEPEEVAESNMSDLDIMRQDLESLTDRQFMAAYNMTKRAFQQKYRTLLKPAPEQDSPVEEGYQDFTKKEPYEVCLAGKCVKTFDYYEDARRFHDNWKKKLYREGNKAKADKITLNPVMKEEEQKPAGWGEFPPKQEIKILPPKKLKSGETHQGINDYWRAQGQAPIYKTNEDTGSWIVYDPKTKQIKKRFKTHTAGKSYAQTHGLGFASSEYYFDNIKEKAVAEDNKHIEMSPVESAIIRRIMMTHPDLLSQFGPEAVFNAARDEADFVGDVDEIGSSDVSGWVKQVERMLKEKAVAEAETDYSKRRRRERDVDAGKPVARQPKNPQTDYARKRAEQRRQEALGETVNYWVKLQNERNTKAAKLIAELQESIKDIK
jgi:hypothetical protein